MRACFKEDERDFCVLAAHENGRVVRENVSTVVQLCLQGMPTDYFFAGFAFAAAGFALVDLAAVAFAAGFALVALAAAGLALVDLAAVAFAAGLAFVVFAAAGLALVDLAAVALAGVAFAAGFVDLAAPAFAFGDFVAVAFAAGFALVADLAAVLFAAIPNFLRGGDE
ncbi:MAG: hypothetical protein R3C20_10470 [Planctomycetaceae bacterium]